MGRQECCEKGGVKKGPWTGEEDRKLLTFMTRYASHVCWRQVPRLAGLLRCGKSCRLRWINYLRPDLKRGLISEAEEKLIIHLHSAMGNRWSRIAARLPGRTDNEIKNYWNTRIKKRLSLIMGAGSLRNDPLICSPNHNYPPSINTNSPSSSSSSSITTSCNDHLIPLWESSPPNWPTHDSPPPMQTHNHVISACKQPLISTPPSHSHELAYKYSNMINFTPNQYNNIPPPSSIPTPIPMQAYNYVISACKPLISPPPSPSHSHEANHSMVSFIDPNQYITPLPSSIPSNVPSFEPPINHPPHSYYYCMEKTSSKGSNCEVFSFPPPSTSTIPITTTPSKPPTNHPPHNHYHCMEKNSSKTSNCEVFSFSPPSTSTINDGYDDNNNNNIHPSLHDIDANNCNWSLEAICNGNMNKVISNNPQGGYYIATALSPHQVQLSPKRSSTNILSINHTLASSQIIGQQPTSSLDLPSILLDQV